MPSAIPKGIEEIWWWDALHLRPPPGNQAARRSPREPPATARPPHGPGSCQGMVQHGLYNETSRIALPVLGWGLSGAHLPGDPTQGSPLSQEWIPGTKRGASTSLFLPSSSPGGHINPAVSFAMCLTGKMKWAKFPIYVLAQYLGAFLGAAVVFGINYGEWKRAVSFALAGISHRNPKTSLQN